MASQDRILEAARIEFAQHGYAARLQDIAERAANYLNIKPDIDDNTKLDVIAQAEGRSNKPAMRTQ